MHCELQEDGSATFESTGEVVCPVYFTGRIFSAGSDDRKLLLGSFKTTDVALAKAVQRFWSQMCVKSHSRMYFDHKQDRSQQLDPKLRSRLASDDFRPFKVNGVKVDRHMSHDSWFVELDPQEGSDQSPINRKPSWLRHLPVEVLIYGECVWSTDFNCKIEAIKWDDGEFLLRYSYETEDQALAEAFEALMATVGQARICDHCDSIVTDDRGQIDPSGSSCPQDCKTTVLIDIRPVT